MEKSYFVKNGKLNVNKMESIELRIILTPEDELFDFVLKIKNFLETKKPAMILRFILGKSSKIPFSEFIKINQDQKELIESPEAT